MPTQESLVANRPGADARRRRLRGGPEYAAGVDATVLGQASTATSRPRLEALDADGDDVDGGDDIDVDIAGAQQHGMKTVLSAPEIRPTLSRGGIGPMRPSS